MDGAIASTSLLAITSSIGIFNSLCPPFHTIRQATGDPRTVADVRTAEVAAVALTVAIGLIGSGMTKSPLPAVLSVVAAGALVLMYESVLRSTPIEMKG